MGKTKDKTDTDIKMINDRLKKMKASIDVFGKMADDAQKYEKPILAVAKKLREQQLDLKILLK